MDRDKDLEQDQQEMAQYSAKKLVSSDDEEEGIGYSPRKFKVELNIFTYWSWQSCLHMNGQQCK